MNPNCDNDKCIISNGIVKLLPTSCNGHILLCKNCYEIEMKFRKSEIKRTGSEIYQLPSWDSLEEYKSE